MRLLKKDLLKETFKVVEIFRTVEGEGRWVGLPVVFIRLEGCNLRCSWCDTTYSYDGKSYTVKTLKDILQEINSYKLKRVCITGGEPFLTPNLDILVKSLLEENYYVFIETNGTLWNENFKDIITDNLYITCSPKPPLYFVNKELLPYIKELKFVVDENLSINHIIKPEFVNIIKNDIIVLQPESNKPEMVEKALNLQDQLLQIGIESRIIPQCHKVLGLP
ncbi:7-carboxy-7-deazaguanine synthase QueE [Sulfurihydrogenibium subterraneum]|uniref:7-carboxy-7-deazaguanine synthase QueE n=1 Tax=Sulfurihydrogenibium subterraneum TaxID=171121 RepID=UPI00048FFF87|nr:7-carboxy-7-deazaguanine synthase QueE [Sulfurihydrogenibium subterraneum]